ncbi:3'-5' exonuclease [Actinoplanes flavus]|uniref:3'-5' exonuclease n=1 Tax=Actinoplanes flavus TaxID=2820290 RepID=A0ABS3UFH7_9ACTN|nr:3'-5' exonuclease [Actinoplanes flavus]MBO3737533.1 3'-5' exonuclease [Actinoplanes flavus]
METTWREATNLVALDLEGSGAQDGDQEAILEIAAVRLIAGRPDAATAYATLIDPGRPIPARPWISPGLAGTALSGAPTLDDVEPQLARRLDGAYLVGHKIGVDWRLLYRRCPSISIAGLIDTHRLAKALPATGKNSLTELLARHRLTDAVNAVAPASRPHRALWDTIGASLLLDTLIQQHWTGDPSLDDLLAVAAPPGPKTTPAAQATLFD